MYEMSGRGEDSQESGSALPCRSRVNVEVLTRAELRAGAAVGGPEDLSWADAERLGPEQRARLVDGRIPVSWFRYLAATVAAYPPPGHPTPPTTSPAADQKPDREAPSSQPAAGPGGSALEQVQALIGQLPLTDAVTLLDEAPPGPVLGAVIERGNAERAVLGGAGWEALISATGRQIAHLHAVQYSTVGEFMADIASRDLPPNSPLQDIGRHQAQASLGAALLLPPGTALRIVDDAETLTQRFPATLAALDAGTIDQHKARSITDELDFGHLTDEQRSGAEAALLDWAQSHTTRSTQARARRIIERLDPGAHERRHQDRLTERDVTHEETGDGMGAIRWEDDALATRAFHTWLNDTARALDKSDARSMKERRADIWRDILTALITGTPLPAGLTLPPALVHDMAATDQDKPTPDQADTRHAHPNQSDTSQDDTGQDDTGQDDTGQNDTGQSEAGQSEAGQSEAGQSEAGQSEAGQSEAGGSPDTAEPAAQPFTGAASAVPSPRPPGDPDTTEQPHHVARGVGARTTLIVHIDLPTFLQMRDGVTRITDGTAHLEGHGDLTVSQTTAVLAAATRIRFAAVDPETGTCLHLGATQSYTPPKSMRDTVDAAHLVCRFPGCRRTAQHCDCDHRTDHAEGGPTCPCNLAPLCRTHHNLKTHGGWTVEPEDPRTPFGTMIWTSPAARKYLDHPEDPPLPPPLARSAPSMQNSDSDPPPY